MIFIDVTAACLIPLQSGIPRTTRGLFREIKKAHPDVRPVLWQPFYHGYSPLSSRAERLLDDPFASDGRIGKAPSDWTLPLLWASLKHLFSGKPRLGPGHLTGTRDTLLVTSLFPDNRLLYLRGLMRGPGRKVAIFHDAIPLVDPHVPKWGRPFHRYLLELLSLFDLVVCVSHASEGELRRLWQEHGLAPAPTRVIPWPVPFDRERLPFRPPGSEGPPTILYVSRLKRMKNHQVLLQACERLWGEGCDFRLQLIGCRDVPNESGEILRQISEFQSRGRPVFWQEHVDEDALHQAYAASSFTVFPSRMEGFGLPILESFWHGRPVICSAEGAMGEVSCGPGVCHTRVDDPTCLANSMRQLLSDPDRLRKLSEAAYQRPVRSWSDYGRDLEDCLS